MRRVLGGPFLRGIGDISEIDNHAQRVFYDKSKDPWADVGCRRDGQQKGLGARMLARDIGSDLPE